MRHWPPGPDVLAWTRGHNAPAVLYENEPPLGGWADISALAERLAPEPRLIPRGPERVELFGLAHELLGVGGVAWNARALLIDESLTSGGQRGFPLRIAQFLSTKYQYRVGDTQATKERVLEGLALLAHRLRQSADAGPYFYGQQLSALDIYSATVFHLLAPLPPEQCPRRPDAASELRVAARRARERHSELLARAPQAHVRASPRATGSALLCGRPLA